MRKLNPMTKELKKKILSIVAIVVLGCILIGSGAWIGWTAGRKYPENIAVSEATNIAPNASTTSAADFNTFWAAWADIQNESLWTPSTTPTQRMYGAITGMVGSLGDPYTEFFTPADSSQFQEDITGNFGGIGAELGENSSTEIVVIEAISSTPAFAAGLKPEDIITSINGSSTASMNVDDAVNLIRGTVGTNVTLGILRAGLDRAEKLYDHPRQHPGADGGIFYEGRHCGYPVERIHAGRRRFIFQGTAKCGKCQRKGNRIRLAGRSGRLSAGGGGHLGIFP